MNGVGGSENIDGKSTTSLKKEKLGCDKDGSSSASESLMELERQLADNHEAN